MTLKIGKEITDNKYNNTINENDNKPEELEFNYNFISMPWDDRKRGSKIGIILLLISIFVSTMALVVYNFYIHYRNYESKSSMNSNEISCYRLKIDEYPYVARLHSATTYELLCLGAVVSSTSILATGVCVRFGKLKMYIGSMSDPQCRRGFTVDVSESILHPTVLSKRLVLLSSYEKIEDCSDPVKIGDTVNFDKPIQVIGRPFAHGRSLSRQYVSLADKSRRDTKTPPDANNYTIIGKDLTRCPVRAGDLVLQDGRLFGLAAFQKGKFAFFASLDPIKRELKEIDSGIGIENFHAEGEFLRTRKNN